MIFSKQSFFRKLGLTVSSVLFILTATGNIGLFGESPPPPPAVTEKYSTSAHGHSTDGVNRSGMGNYAIGNCAHCHEQHASIGGSEPAPSKPGPSAYAVFSDNFNTIKTVGPYVESDNFCFYCHYGLGTYQQVLNYDFCRVFGGAPTSGGDIPSILDAFNQTSYHNLYNIDVFAKANFSSWYKAGANPCDACHNPHLAKDNASNPTDPNYTAISKPSNHAHLLGIASPGERMSNYPTYIAPYASSTANREPAASGVGDGSDMPNYVDYCLDCHNTGNTIYSTTLARNLIEINWSATGDKHGGTDMDGHYHIEGPYQSAGGYVLSCMDCHEPHGSQNLMLTRRWVNGGALDENISDNTKWGRLCTRCHQDDSENSDVAGGVAYKFAEVHHGGGSGLACSGCHAGSPDRTKCTSCHLHGKTLSTVKTF